MSPNTSKIRPTTLSAKSLVTNCYNFSLEEDVEGGGDKTGGLNPVDQLFLCFSSLKFRNISVHLDYLFFSEFCILPNFPHHNN